jgi:DNA-binding XRE family transcriptional regulator
MRQMDYKRCRRASALQDHYAIYEYSIGAYMKSRGILAIRVKSNVDLVAIGSRIRMLRGAMLQEELAFFLDISQGHLSKIERGKIAPSLEILTSISRKFRRSVDWILLGEES